MQQQLHKQHGKQAEYTAGQAVQETHGLPEEHGR